MIPFVPIAFAVLALLAWRYDARARRAYEATLSDAEKNPEIALLWARPFQPYVCLPEGLRSRYRTTAFASRSCSPCCLLSGGEGAWPARCTAAPAGTGLRATHGYYYAKLVR